STSLLTPATTSPRPPAPTPPHAPTLSHSSPSAPTRDLHGRQSRGTFLTSPRGDTINESQQVSSGTSSLEAAGPRPPISWPCDRSQPQATDAGVFGRISGNDHAIARPQRGVLDAFVFEHERRQPFHGPPLGPAAA